MSEKNEETDRIRISQVLAGALAAVTAALIGSTMGVGGTVVGAGVASVISTIGGTLYLKSIQRTREGVRTVHAKVVGRSGGATVLVTTDDPDPAPTPGEEVEAEAAEPADRESAEEPVVDRPPTDRRRRWPVYVVTTIAAFALGMLAVTGVEWLRGESLSGDSGTTFGSIVAPHQSSGGDEDPADQTTTTDPTTTPPTTSTEPTTTAPPTSTSTTTPPSEPSTTTTTTTPPVTTTSEAPPSQGSAPASG